MMLRVECDSIVHAGTSNKAKGNLIDRINCRITNKAQKKIYS
jgi:hypothetical protein